MKQKIKKQLKRKVSLFDGASTGGLPAPDVEQINDSGNLGLLDSDGIQILESSNKAAMRASFDFLVKNPHPGMIIDEGVVRASIGSDVYWASHRAQGNDSDTLTNLGYEYKYNSTDGNSELASQAGVAGWQSVYTSSDNMIYTCGQIYADSVIFRAAVWTINLSSSDDVTFTSMNAAGQATGDINELIGIIDDGSRLVVGERGGGGLTDGSDYPNGGGLWTIPKATLTTASDHVRVYENTHSPTWEWRNIAKLDDVYIGFLCDYTNGKYEIQSSTDLTNWTVRVDGSALSLNDIRGNLINHSANGKAYAVAVNGSRQVVLYDSSDGINWSTTTFTDITAHTSGSCEIALGEYGSNLLLLVGRRSGYRHQAYYIYNLDTTPIALKLADLRNYPMHAKLSVNGTIGYYGVSYRAGAFRVRFKE